jgi:multisubunit Na+/H+ antiporter MnhC subunit
MELWLTVAIGMLFGTGTYLVLRRSLLKVVIGSH